jgi:hypothetical protein
MDGTLRVWQTNGQELLRIRMSVLDRSRGLWGLLKDKPLPPIAWNWATLDFRTDPRGRWMGQGSALDTVRYIDPTDPPQPWPWVPRYWRASDVPELRVCSSE